MHFNILWEIRSIYVSPHFRSDQNENEIVGDVRLCHGQPRWCQEAPEVNWPACVWSRRPQCEVLRVWGDPGSGGVQWVCPGAETGGKHKLRSSRRWGTARLPRRWAETWSPDFLDKSIFVKVVVAEQEEAVEEVLRETETPGPRQVTHWCPTDTVTRFRMTLETTSTSRSRATGPRSRGSTAWCCLTAGYRQSLTAWGQRLALWWVTWHLETVSSEEIITGRGVLLWRWRRLHPSSPRPRP